MTTSCVGRCWILGKANASSDDGQQSGRRPSTISQPISNNARRNSSSSTKSFNIFDGSGASGAFAEYIFDGDSDDLSNDLNESIQWAGVIQHHV